jgi:hypothetical protein
MLGCVRRLKKSNFGCGYVQTLKCPGKRTLNIMWAEFNPNVLAVSQYNTPLQAIQKVSGCLGGQGLFGRFYSNRASKTL